MTLFIPDWSVISFLVFGLCILLFIVQFFYWFFIYRRVGKAFAQDKPLPADKALPPISVVMVTNDSGEMLNQHLPRILEQDYPQFEVIVVNSRAKSDDEDILKLLENKYPHLYHTFIPDSARYISKKKLGMSVGIKASKYDWIVSTEPNCYPTSNHWLRSLAASFTPETEIVLGYSNFEGGKGSYAARVRIDGMFHAIRYLGKALFGYPHMGIGRNLAYRKSSYEKHRGFAGQLNLVRGEDDLFVNSIATKANTQICTSKDSIVRCTVPIYKRQWFAEKVHYLVTSSYYKGCAGICNGIETFSSFLFGLLTLIGIGWSAYFSQWIVLGLFTLLWMVRYGWTVIILRQAANVLDEKVKGSIWTFNFRRPWWSLQLKLHYWFRTKADYLRK